MEIPEQQPLLPAVRQKAGVSGECSQDFGVRKGKRGRFQVEPVWCLFAAGRQPTTHRPAASAFSVPSCSAFAVNTEGLFPYLDRGCFVSQMTHDTGPRYWPIGEWSQKRKLLAKASPRLCRVTTQLCKTQQRMLPLLPTLFLPQNTRAHNVFVLAACCLLVRTLSSGSTVGKLSCSQIPSTFLRLA